MPGMTLRAWALVNSTGAMVKGYGVASVTKTGTGTYRLTLTGAAVSATAIIKGKAKINIESAVNAGTISGNDYTYSVNYTSGGTTVDATAHIEVYE